MKETISDSLRPKSLTACGITLRIRPPWLRTIYTQLRKRTLTQRASNPSRPRQSHPSRASRARRGRSLERHLMKLLLMCKTWPLTSTRCRSGRRLVHRPYPVVLVARVVVCPLRVAAVSITLSGAVSKSAPDQGNTTAGKLLVSSSSSLAWRTQANLRTSATSGRKMEPLRLSLKRLELMRLST